ncbi:phage tail sheath subtilisin-like domain-containing protein [Yoonia sediminilitoris]|uniref:Tail sheath protein n=1 Tax=Yoonia sediminilitoris TaxID=1286148 RepID=A0A2T6KBX0_9RHOB|nr:phage tail sheath subtilisin-like domain-containing protein [Yoonia sediminilitoris]PUB12410.1 tail sheath protein [Yoonia sediminilitoris]RCW93104.1 tail sheath protein [Yoonia sediminilitoris]
MEQILPGVSVAVRPEGLIIPGVVSISAIGMVGTANKGPVDTPVLIGSPAAAREVFGEADAIVTAGQELTLIRAIDLAYDHGARDVWAVRIAGATVAADFLIASATGDCCRLTASTPGSWANTLEINITAASESAVVTGEEIAGTGAVALQLAHTTIAESVRNTVSVLAAGASTPTTPTVVHGATGTPAAGQVEIDPATGALTFAAGEAPAVGDTVTVTYVVPAANSAKVTLRTETAQEEFTAASGGHLVSLVTDGSDLVAGTVLANASEVPTQFADAFTFEAFGSGTNATGTDGATGGNYADGFEALNNEPAFIIVAAGQDNSGTIGADLTAHVASASSDSNKRERIGVIGSAPGASLNDIVDHALNSDRIVFVAPGVTVSDVVTGQPVTLSGGYAAACVAGMISGAPVNRSLTNKVLNVADLEEKFSQAELRQLVQNRVLALESRLGFRTVKGITTSTNTAWHQITTRRIVDKAKFGVRSAANPYIGLLNNERVRAAMRSTINSFLAEMVLDEELVSYELEVTATRDDERRGIARVTIVLRPTFSIDFIKVTMFLE